MKNLINSLICNETFSEEWGNMFSCPVCDGYDIHFNTPTHKLSGDVRGVAWEGSGNSIKIPMWCEGGHTWTVRFGFHKGQTYVKIIDIKTEDYELERSLKKKSDEEALAIAYYGAGHEAGRKGETFDWRKPVEMLKKAEELFNPFSEPLVKHPCRFCGAETQIVEEDGSNLIYCPACGDKHVYQYI